MLQATVGGDFVCPRVSTVTVAVGVVVTATVQVVVAWVFDVPLTLDFQPFETATVFLAVIIVNVIMTNGKSNYLDGLMLLSLYLIISLGFIMHDPEEDHCLQDQLWCVQHICLHATMCAVASECTLNNAQARTYP